MTMSTGTDGSLTLRLVVEGNQTTHTLTQQVCDENADLVAAEFERDGVNGPDFSPAISALLTRAISGAKPDFVARAAGCVRFLARAEAIASQSEIKNRFYVVALMTGRIVCARCDHAEEMDEICKDLKLDAPPHIDVEAIRAGAKPDVWVDVSIVCPIGSFTIQVEQYSFANVLEGGLQMTGNPSEEVVHRLYADIRELLAIACKAAAEGNDPQLRHMVHQATMRASFIIAMSMPPTKFLDARHMLFKMTPEGFTISTYGDDNAGEYKSIMDGVEQASVWQTDETTGKGMRATLH